MQTDILINWSPQETRVALVEGALVQELHIERTLGRGLVGNIYLGKVVRVLPGMQSAFIDIGLDKAAFLHNADCGPRYAKTEEEQKAPIQPIEKKVFEGQTLLVQVIKDPILSKGARLSTQISLAGRFLVYLPTESQVGVSQKIPPIQREALRLRLGQLMQLAGSNQNAHEGFILRTNAEDASDAELLQDMAYLRLMWRKVQSGAVSQAPKSLLHTELSLVQRVLRDFCNENTRSVRIDSEEQFNALHAFAAEFMPFVLPRLQLYRGEKPLFDLACVDEAINKALDRRVELKSGGYLVFDQTEAMTTIDVNTGAYVGARNFDETIFKTNLEAAQAIARELRLRNLGGIVIVDFIDMVRPEHRAGVLEQLRKKLQQDRVKTLVSDFSHLGLVEMTRKRSSESLSQMLTETCAVCHGRGRVKTVRSVAYEILREILREARQFNPKEFRVISHPSVVEIFLDEESSHLAGLSDFIGKPITLQAQAMMSQEEYDIVLM